MILKKPYAFLIKHFRLINMLIFLLTIFVVLKTNNIRVFFNNYVLNNYTTNNYAGFYQEYISIFIFLALILIIVGIISILILFGYKKKPIKLYIASVSYYVLLFIYLIYVRSIMISMETVAIAAETARAYRDITLLVFIPQIVFIISFLIRSLGLDIKKFNFEQDLKDLKISSEDNEEIEVVINNKNVYKYFRQGRRALREFLYYIKENKFMFIVISSICVVLLAIFIYNLFPTIIDKRYVQGQTFYSNGLNIKVEDSIVTNLDYQGNQILNDDNYYLVVKLIVENNSDDAINFDYNLFRLYFNKEYIYPTKDQAVYFIDYAENNISKKIKSNSKTSYSLVYKLNDSKVKKNYKLKVTNGTAFVDGGYVGKFIYVSLSPLLLNKVINESTVNEGETLNLSSSNLKNTNIVVSNAQVTDKYIYDYEKCINNECNTYKDIINTDYIKRDKTLFVFDASYDLDKDSTFAKYSTSSSTFFGTFGKVRYVINDKEYISSIKNVTPANMINSIAYEVPSEIKNATNIDLLIVVRNKMYTVKVK